MDIDLQSATVFHTLLYSVYKRLADDTKWNYSNRNTKYIWSNVYNFYTTFSILIDHCELAKLLPKSSQPA